MILRKNTSEETLFQGHENCSQGSNYTFADIIYDILKAMRIADKSPSSYISHRGKTPCIAVDNWTL